MLLLYPLSYSSFYRFYSLELQSIILVLVPLNIARPFLSVCLYLLLHVFCLIFVCVLLFQNIDVVVNVAVNSLHASVVCF